MANINEQDVYVILVNDDNTMTTTQKRNIVQRSKLVDDLWFLIKPEYNGYNMADFTVVLEYLQPVSRKYRTEFLDLEQDLYNGYLKYTLPVDTEITSEAGDVEFQMSFLRSELDSNGRGVQRVRKVTGTTIHVTPISAWSDIIPDCALTALDQRIIKMDAQIRALNNATNSADGKADNLSYNKNTSELQLLSGTKPIGNKVVLSGIGGNGSGGNINPDENDQGNGDSGGSNNPPDDDNVDTDDGYNDVIEF